jgi:hypothetical protein
MRIYVFFVNLHSEAFFLIYSYFINAHIYTSECIFLILFYINTNLICTKDLCYTSQIIILNIKTHQYRFQIRSIY